MALWHHRFVRWLIGLIICAVSSTASAHVFKPRSRTGAPKKAPIVAEKAEKAERPKAKAPKARPKTTRKAPKPKKDDVVIVEEKEDDVLVKDDE